MTSLVIGCPVRDRAWIIRQWFDHVVVAVDKAGINRSDVDFAFVGDYEKDETFRLIDRCCLEHWFGRYVIDQPGTAAPYRRAWSRVRYAEMAALRNALLERVREVAPDYYWSLDSDILVHPDALVSLLDAIQNFDAVGGACYMGDGTKFPSYANLLPRGGLYRKDTRDILTVDVIMASKLMSPAAYAIDYTAKCHQGEDTDWSTNARDAGLTLGWDGRVVSKHVMSLPALDKFDKRCGF